MDRKNTLLLTVIAVATLLVAVVGATFAYFTAQGNGNASKAVEVKTKTTNSAVFAMTGNFSITADQDNFSSADTSITESGTGTATFTANNVEDADMCYNVSLTISANDFVYCADETTTTIAGRTPCATDDTITDKNAKEITFTAKKTPNGGTETTLLDAVDITKGTAEVKIPNAAGGTNYEHKLHAAAGDSVTDNWNFDVTLVNLNHDQEYNTDKTFTGAITFTQVTCAA